MDFNLKQWRNLSEQEEQDHEISELGPPSLKIPKLEINSHSQQSTVSSALHLFVPEHSATTNNNFPKMGSYFSLAQWQELELQALIYRHMIAGATVPSELLQLVKKSIITSSPYYMSNSIYYPHYQPALVQSGYWGRGAMDPEPGRCRRTDGKKWRCSRDVVAGQKYCERHVHRGRNRSRKPVEIPTSSTITTTSSTQGVVTGGSTSKFTLTGPTPSMDLLHFGQRSSDSIIETKGPFGTAEDGQQDSGRTLRHFFDDWPRSLHDTDGTTNLSISMPENSSSDFSLKLGTGNSVQVARNESERPQLNWGGRWDTHRAAPVGGPLAEALQSSMSNASPTSVLRLVPSASTSGASFISS